MRRLASLVVTLALLVAAGPAHAGVAPATTLDGPSADILGLGGVAMSEDGTGGIVYRRRVDGVPHVFAAQFTRGAWQPPQRIDGGQRFESSFPVIGAADGGVLVVVWAQEFGTNSDRLYSAVLGRGARRFQAPTLIDANIGEAIGTYPSLVLNRGGAGYVAYNIVTSTATNAALPPGYAAVERRLARFSGQYWSGLGFSFARNSGVPVRLPTAGNSPKVVIDTAGNGILAFQEPDDDFVDRIYSRRVFGSTLGVARQVSPSTLSDKPLRGAADAFSLDTAGFGQGAIAFRQQPAEGSALAAPVDMVALISETFAEDAAKFGAPRTVFAGDAPGPPTVAVTADGAFLTGLSSAKAALTIGGDDQTVDAPKRLDAGMSDVAPDPSVDLAPSGAAVSAFGVSVDRRAGVQVNELRADGVPEQRTVSATRGGQVGGVMLAGSGLGDALVGFVQGTGSGSQIAAAVVDAPPDVFQVQTPIDWVSKARIPLRWDPSTHAIGGVSYTITVDDQTVAEDLTGTTYTLSGDDTEPGRQTVAVIARDSGGQETTSDPAELKVDRTPPKVTVSRTGSRGIDVRLADKQSGVQVSSARLRIGAGKLLSGRRHFKLRLTRAGRYRAWIRVSDNAGNTARAVRWVRTR